MEQLNLDLEDEVIGSVRLGGVTYDVRPLTLADHSKAARLQIELGKIQDQLKNTGEDVGGLIERVNDLTTDLIGIRLPGLDRDAIGRLTGRQVQRLSRYLRDLGDAADKAEADKLDADPTEAALSA